MYIYPLNKGDICKINRNIDLNIAYFVFNLPAISLKQGDYIKIIRRSDYYTTFRFECGKGLEWLEEYHNRYRISKYNIQIQREYFNVLEIPPLAEYVYKEDGLKLLYDVNKDLIIPDETDITMQMRMKSTDAGLYLWQRNSFGSRTQYINSINEYKKKIVKEEKRKRTPSRGLRFTITNEEFSKIDVDIIK